MKQKIPKEKLKEMLTEASKNIRIKPDFRGQEKRIIEQWKTQKAVEINIAEFKTAEHLILVTLKGFSNATVITGEGGIGKTFLTVETVKKELQKDEWDYKSGFTSPLAFYKYLYFNRNKKLLVIDDVEGIFDNDKSVNILKGTLWDTAGKRMVSYDTTSDKAEGVPNVFEIKANLIILCNKIPNIDDKNTSALISRTIYYELEFSYAQKLKIINEILALRNDINKKQKKLVIEIIKQETSLATKNFNLRSMERLIAYVEYNPEKALCLFKETTKSDEDKERVIKLMDSGRTVEEQVKEFFRETGKARRTFFRIKKNIKKDSAKVPLKENVTDGSGGKNETKNRTSRSS